MSTRLTQIILTDGRARCLEQTVQSFDLGIDNSAVSRRVIINDCLDPAYGRWITERFSFDELVPPLRGRKRGFGGAVRAAWAYVDNTDYVMHLEDDFVLMRWWDVRAVMDVLTEHPHLAQMALRRQPWNEAETAAGGIVELHPEAYVDASDPRGRHWLEHRMFFTTNPSIYPARIATLGWPAGGQSEGIFSAHLFGNPQTTCGFWGKRTDMPWVTHIGNQRVGVGY